MRYLVKNKNTIMFAFAILLCAIIASCEDAKYDTIGSRIYLAESSSLSYESKKVTVAEEGSVVTVTPRTNCNKRYRSYFGTKSEIVGSI